jgi:hypothetical protein
MNFILGLRNTSKNHLCELLRQEFALAELFAGFVEREFGQIHSMILGTLKKPPWVAGALASSASVSG